MTGSDNNLRLVRAGIDTYRQPVVYMREDCDLCRAEGFSTQTRIKVRVGEKSLIATLNVVTDADWLPQDAVALSNWAWECLTPQPGARVDIFHTEPAASASAIRAKVYGQHLNTEALREIINDTVANRLSDLDLAAFVTACAGERLNTDETVGLTRAMQEAGQTLDWGERLVLDKHCVGGLPGNRTTPIIVAIVAAAGYLIPKTSSRAITSPAGTADTMETMTPVALDIAAMRRVVEAEGGCMVWGGGLSLSPADDLLIRIERALDFDSEGQLVASILSKKAAAGASHVLIDIPVGPTAKVRSDHAALSLRQRLVAVADAVGLHVTVHHSDGTAPVGRGIGPALEARDVLSVLRRDPDAPIGLRDRALDLAGILLELAGGREGTGRSQAKSLLDNGSAEAKFLAICAAQGGFRDPIPAGHRHVITARTSGQITATDNRQVARIAKLSGAPGRKAAGVLLRAQPGQRLAAGDPLYEIHAETQGELAWAREFAMSGNSAFQISEAL